MNEVFANQPEFVHIFAVEDHDVHKAKLLAQIESMIKDHKIEKNEKGYWYDYPLTARRPYEYYFRHVVYPYAIEVGEKYGLRPRRDKGHGRPWFQQYVQGSDFGWHQHEGHWAIIYFVELPEPNEATEFLDYDIRLKEGDLIFFPTFLVHRSPEIKSNTRKTIISTNMTYQVDRDYIELHHKKDFI